LIKEFRFFLSDSGKNFLKYKIKRKALAIQGEFNSSFINPDLLSRQINFKNILGKDDQDIPE